MIKQEPQVKYIVSAGLILFIAVVGYYVLNAPDRRDGWQKIGDAISEVPNGMDEAGRQLEDRTPAEKLKDAAKDAGNDIRKATNQ